MQEFIDKLIGRLEEWSFETEIVIPGSDGYDDTENREIICTKNAIEIVKELAEEHNNGWILCSERLPEEYGEYLCYNQYGEYILGYPKAQPYGDGFYVENASEGLDYIIAWRPRPLPPAYKEGGV